MIGQALKQLIDRQLTSLDEVQSITGRGNSTVYRWLNGESTPSCDNVCALLTNLRNLEARKLLLATATNHLPVAIEWLNDDGDIVLLAEKDRAKAQAQTIDLTIRAMECLTDILRHYHENLSNNELNEEQFTQFTTQIDDAVRHLTNSKHLLAALVTKRKKARLIVTPHEPGRAPPRKADSKRR